MVWNWHKMEWVPLSPSLASWSFCLQKQIVCNWFSLFKWRVRIYRVWLRKSKLQCDLQPFCLLPICGKREIEMRTQWEVSCVPYLCFQLVMQDACSILVPLSHCAHCTPAAQACHLQFIWYSSIHFHSFLWPMNFAFFYFYFLLGRWLQKTLECFNPVC